MLIFTLPRAPGSPLLAAGARPPTRPSPSGPTLGTMAHRKNHVASRCYLARWIGRDGRLRVVTPPSTESKLATPKSVGYRVDFWGRDAKVRRAVEQALGRVESDVANSLRKAASLWPFQRGTTDWFALAYLMAIHLLRAPHTQRYMLAVQQAALKRQLPRYSHWSDEDVETFVATVTSDACRAQLFSDQLPKAASFVASMHWALLEFRDEVLATSDQPVTVVASEHGSDIGPAPVPTAGLTACEEIRMALDPRHALVLTWLNEPDDGPRVRGDDWLAAQLNGTVIKQADDQWFHHPVRRPTTLVPSPTLEQPTGPIGGQLFPGYDSAAAAVSRRRVDTLANLERMIENPVPGQLRVAGVRRNPA